MTTTNDPIRVDPTIFDAKVEEPCLIRVGLGVMQACVPAHWTEEQINTYANENWVPPDIKAMTGASLKLRTQEECDKCALEETDRSDWQERSPCSDRKGYSHVILKMLFD